METSFLTSFLSAFGAGLAASITPCVYPLVPITLAIFGATKDAGRMRSFLLAASYVLGMAAMYTSLGVISALSGSILGSALRNPWLIIGMSGLLIFLSLYTLDIVKLDYIYKLQARFGKVGGKGYPGAFLMGLVSGIVAAPCTAPILITILGVAASTQSVPAGAALLFSYAIGFGMIFLALGTFSGLIHKLPRSGDWLHIVKFFISAGLLIVAFFLLKPLLKFAGPTMLSGTSIFLYVSMAIVALLFATIGHRRNLGLVKFGCAILLAISLSRLLFSPAESNLAWRQSPDDAIFKASTQKKPVMVDFFAEWCASCKEYDNVTFADKEVQSRLSKFEVSRVDLTLADEESDKIHQKYSLAGLPTLVFLCPSGKEIPGTRLQGFKGPAEFLIHLETTLAKLKEC